MVIISFIMSIFVAIQDPIIQKFVIRIAGGYVSSKTGAEVRIGRLNISPNFTITVDRFQVKDLENNNLVNVKQLKVRPVMEDIVHGIIHVDRIELEDAEANLIKYEGEDHLNFQFLIDAFVKDKKDKEKKPVAVQIDRILVHGLDFQYWDQNKDHPEKTEAQLMDYAHINVSDITLDAERFTINGDSIVGRIHHLAANEWSGFSVKYLETDVNVSSHGILLDNLLAETSNSKLDLDLHMRYPDYTAFKDFVNKVEFDADIRPTTLLLSDMGPFTKVLYQMTDPVQVKGRMTGPVSSFRVDDLKCGLGKRTQFEGSLALEPLDFVHGNHTLRINKLNYSYDDLANFHIPTPTKTIPIPASLAPLGHGTIKGYYSGSMDNFNTELFATSEIGNLNANVNMRLDRSKNKVFEGDIEAQGLNVGILANAQDKLGSLDLVAHVTGQQSKAEGLELDIVGNACDAHILGNTINEIALNGNLKNKSFNGKVNIDDDELVFDFSGGLDFNNPKALNGDFVATITQADMRKLNIIKEGALSVEHTTIRANVKNFNNFNQAEGTLSIDNLFVKKDGVPYTMDNLEASIVNDSRFQKRINMDCDYLDFNMAGKMDFTTLGTAFKQYVTHYVEVPKWSDELEAFQKSKKTAEQDFVVSLNLKDPKPLTNLFAPSLDVAKNTTLKGTFTTKSNSLNLTLRSKYVNVNNIKIENIECKSLSSPRRSLTRLNVDHIILRDSTVTNPNRLDLDAATVMVSLENDSILANITWSDDEQVIHNEADIRASFIPTAEGGRFNFSKAAILLNDVLWTGTPDNLIVLDNNKVQVSNIALHNEEQSLVIDGMVPMEAEDTLSVAFHAFDLSSLNFLTKGKGIDLGGRIYGDALVSDLKNDKSILADLKIKQLGLNGDVYGDAEIFSRWNNYDNSIDLDLGLINQEQQIINLTGSFYPQQETDNLDFKLGIDSLSLGILSPFITNIAQRLQGTCYGQVNIKGSLNEPDIQGSVNIRDGGCKINFLNTYYTFSPTITLTENLITLDKLSLRDTLGNSAMVAGYISHNHLKDLYLDIKMYPDNFLAMATTAQLSPSFYGTAIANGVVSVKGPVDDLDLDIRALTRKGTVMTIPLGSNTSVKQHDFITFVNKEELKEAEEEEVVTNNKRKKSNVDIAMALRANDDAQIKISLPNNLGSMEAKGDGNIKLDLTTSTNAMSLIGDYVISSGSLVLNIQDIIKRTFTLDPGSSISWTGDPVNGTIDATGVYQTKASLSSLGLIDTTNMSASNVKVECLVHLKNKLMNPDITFGLRLPNASESLQQAVFYVIDTTNQSDVFMQTVSLLVFNSFNYGSGGSSYGLFTSQLNDFISQFTHDIDINVSYKAGDDDSSEEMTVAMKKQLFDDRLTIETNFGVIRPNSAYATNSTNIVGDVNVDYKITKDGRLSAQVFNRSNYNTYYYQYTYYKMAPYTQGIGLSYNKSFDRFRDIFKKKKHISLSNGPMINKTPQKDTSEQDEPTE